MLTNSSWARELCRSPHRTLEKAARPALQVQPTLSVSPPTDKREGARFPSGRETRSWTSPERRREGYPVALWGIRARGGRGERKMGARCEAPGYSRPLLSDGDYREGNVWRGREGVRQGARQTSGVRARDTREDRVAVHDAVGDGGARAVVRGSAVRASSAPQRGQRVTSRPVSASSCSIQAVRTAGHAGGAESWQRAASRRSR